MTDAASLIFRAYQREDLDWLVALDDACFEASFRFSRSMMRRFAEASNAWTEVALLGDEAIGFCIVHIENLRGTLAGYVMTIDVAEDHRRRGLGRRFIEDAERWLQQRNATTILLHVYSENLAAVRFYAHLGFTEGGAQTDFYGPGRDALLLWKQLDR